METVHCSFVGIDIKERMAKQRQLLNARLGLDVVSKIGIDVSGLFTNEDLLTPTPNTLENEFKFEDDSHKVYFCFSNAQ